MPVVVTKEIKKKRKLLAIFAVSMLASGLVLYFGLFRQAASPTPPDEPAAAEAGLPPAGLGSEVPRLELRLLEDERFKNLQPPPGLPLATTTTAGKENPFSD
ncbi:MAG: hypothetical protein HY454_00530 [Parcubacteria group bacterium]|nr:hypothetical protein [Parcubacteria group bacterium]